MVGRTSTRRQFPVEQCEAAQYRVPVPGCGQASSAATSACAAGPTSPRPCSSADGDRTCERRWWAVGDTFGEAIGAVDPMRMSRWRGDQDNCVGQTTHAAWPGRGSRLRNRRSRDCSPRSRGSRRFPAPTGSTSTPLCISKASCDGATGAPRRQRRCAAIRHAGGATLVDMIRRDPSDRCHVNDPVRSLPLRPPLHETPAC